MKKNISLLILTLTLALSSFSQGHKYIPFSDSAFIWRVMTYDGFNNKELNYQYFTNGDDTVINGKEYFIIYKTRYADLRTTGLKQYIRNDTVGRKVYIYPCASNDKEGVLYDFSLKIGDTTKSKLWGGGGMCIYPEGLIVTGIDSIMLNDGWHHRWHFFGNGTFDTVYPMIEGIGGRCGPFEAPVVFEYASWLLCAMKEFKPFFPNNIDTCELATGIVENVAADDSYNLYPNPVLGTLHIGSSRGFKANLGISIYDLMGKELNCQMEEVGTNEIIIDTSELMKGLYFLFLEMENGIVFNTRFVKE